MFNVLLKETLTSILVQCGSIREMILKYKFTDNQLVKEDALMYPQHLQENIKLEFIRIDESLPNTKYYVHVKTTDNVKRLRLKKYDGKYSCELPKWTTHHTFFKLQVHTITENKHFTTNEIIVPVRVLDYLGHDRLVAHSLPKLKSDECYDKDFIKQQKRYDYIKEMEELLIQNLEEKGVTTKNSDTLKDLINKIKEIE